MKPELINHLNDLRARILKVGELQAGKHPVPEHIPVSDNELRSALLALRLDRQEASVTKKAKTKASSVPVDLNDLFS